MRLLSSLLIVFSAAVLTAAHPAPEIRPVLAQPAVDLPVRQEKPAQPGESLDERILLEDKQKTDGPALLTFFKERTYSDPDPAQLAALVKQLGDPSFREREKAYAGLLRFGPSALPVLKAAERDDDGEIVARSKGLRERIEARANPQVQAAAARLLAERKPAGAAEVLLAFLPFAADEGVADEVCRTLAAVAVRGGKAEPALVQALKDKLPARRAGAGAALAAGGAKAELSAVRQLLKDAEPAVRLRVAVALVRTKDKEAIEPLIELLGQLSPDELWPAEDLLFRIAGEKAPQVGLGNDEAGRQKCQQAWKEWYTAHAKNLKLDDVDLNQTLLGFTVLALHNNGRVVGVMELDAAGKKRWSFETNSTAADAQVIKDDRVLVAEYNACRVTIRNFKGEVQFEKNVGANPISAQHLPNGNIFVVAQQKLVEYDAAGKEVWALPRNAGDIFRGRKLRSGEVLFITSGGDLMRVAADGKDAPKHLFNVGPMRLAFGSMDVLPNGNVLVPQFDNHRVVEFDRQGKVVWQANVQVPILVQRLPNGHTLVASCNATRVTELDRAGREVASGTFALEGFPYNVRRR
jgi:hypothetical protein